MGELSQAPQLMEFLIQCFEKDIELNIFTDTDGFERGISDGKAKQSSDYINLIRSLGYDQ